MTIHKHGSIEKLVTYNSIPGFYIKVFFINDRLNGNIWKVTKTSIPDGLKSGLEKRYNGKTAPFIVMPDYEQPDKLGHPDPLVPNMIEIQEPARKGDFVAAGGDESDAWVVVKINDTKTQKDIQDGKIVFVSPSIESIAENEKGEDVKWRVNHLAAVDDPAYGNKAHITGTCTGGDECIIHLTKHAKLCKLNQNNSFKALDQDTNKLNEEDKKKYEKQAQDDKDKIKDLEAKIAKQSNDTEDKKKIENLEAKVKAAEEKEEEREKQAKHEIASKIADEMEKSEEIKSEEKEAAITKMAEEDVNVLKERLQAKIKIAEITQQAKQAKQTTRYVMDSDIDSSENKQAAENVQSEIKSFRSSIYN